MSQVTKCLTKAVFVGIVAMAMLLIAFVTVDGNGGSLVIRWGVVAVEVLLRWLGYREVKKGYGAAVVWGISAGSQDECVRGFPRLKEEPPPTLGFAVRTGAGRGVVFLIVSEDGGENLVKTEQVLSPLFSTVTTTVKVTTAVKLRPFVSSLQGEFHSSNVSVFYEWEKKLGRKPTAAELYYKCHADSGGRFVNSKAEMVWNDYVSKKAANLECETENQKTKDEFFLEPVGGWNDKGRLFGLGAAADSYYDRPRIEENRTKKSRREYAMELENKFIDLVTENMEQKKELDATKESLVETQKSLAETQNTLKALEQQVQMLLQSNKISISPTTTSTPTDA
uniref:Uncharacterized protein n=1 Tax=Chenopodium quinoa TaxID=63459 RepID=A0A803ML83_CHEQI